MSFLQAPLYVSYLAMLFAPSIVQRQQFAAQQGAFNSNLCTFDLDAVQTAVHKAVVGRCMLCLACMTCLLCLAC